MTSITIKEYVAEPGSRYSNKDAEKIGPVIQSLSEAGAVTPRDIVDAARSGNSPIHEFFEWNDKKAADLFRVEQARNMLRSIRVRYIEDGTPKEARAFAVTKTNAYEDEPRQYRSFQVLYGDSAFAANMMDNAITDIMAWKKRYSPYADMWMKFGDVFQGVINQIFEFREFAKIENATAETDAALAKLIAWRDEASDILELWTAAREHVNFMMQAIGDAETTFGRLDQRRERECLKCGHTFKSMSYADRLCPACSPGESDEAKIGRPHKTLFA